MTHNFRSLIIAVALVVCFSAGSFAETYYISPKGKAANPGTQVKPWSLNKANSDLQPGDTAVLLGGKYTTQIAPARSGLAGKPITYKAFKSRTADMDLDQPILLAGRSYITIDGIKADNCKGRWIDGNGASHIVINDCYFKKSGGWESMQFRDSGGYITVTNCFITNGRDEVHIRRGAGHYIANNKILEDSHSPLVLMGCSESIIENNYFSNPTHRIIEILAVREEYNPIDKTEFIVIQDNYFGLSGKVQAIKMAGSNSILRRNIFDGCTEGVRYPSSYGSKLSYRPEGWFSQHNRTYNNTFYGCKMALRFSKQLQTIEAGGAYGDNVFINNIIYGGTSTTQFDYRHQVAKTDMALLNNSILKDSPGQGLFRWWSKEKEAYHFASLLDMQTDYPDNYADNVELDPQFVDTKADNFALAAGSKCIDAGSNLTVTTAAGTGKVITVADALFFTDGYGLIAGDTIRVGDAKAKIIDVDYAGNRLTVDSEITWAEGEKVWLDFIGAAPDLGAFEFGTASKTDPR